MERIQSLVSIVYVVCYAVIYLFIYLIFLRLYLRSVCFDCLVSMRTNVLFVITINLKVNIYLGEKEKELLLVARFYRVSRLFNKYSNFQLIEKFKKKKIAIQTIFCDCGVLIQSIYLCFKYFGSVFFF